jgi:primosomal replication protein N
LPALDVVLAHESEVSEDGSTRKVSMNVKAVTIGQRSTRQVAALALGQPAGFAGFLAASRNGRGLVFHITELNSSIEVSGAHHAPTAR